MTGLPFAPYEGPEPYIFVSYAHKNKDKVYPIIKRLHEMGYRLWYDEGIEAGDEWPYVIEDHLKRTAVMLLFLTPDAVESRNVRSEINVAWDDGIKTISVDLVPTELKYGLSLRLTLPQRVRYYNYTDEAAFYEKVRRGLPEETKESWLTRGVQLIAKADDDVKYPKPDFTPKALPETDFEWENQARIETRSQMYYRGKDKPAPTSVLSPAPALKPSPETDFEWKIEGDNAILVRYKGKEKDVVIPATYQGKQVTKIDDSYNFFSGHYRSFEGNSFVETVCIPEGVVFLGAYAFSSCSNLKSISMPKSIKTIDGFAFSFTNRNLTFHCPRGSYAEQYAKKHKFKVSYTD